MSDTKYKDELSTAFPGARPHLQQLEQRSSGKTFKVLLAAVVLSIASLYCVPRTDVDAVEAPFQFNVTKPLPSSAYALCSARGPHNDPQKSIYTVDDERPRVECLLVANDEIMETGSLAITNVEQDSHCHILEYGFSRQIPLDQAKNVQDAVNRVAEYVLSNPDIANDPNHVIEGWGWDHESWDDPKFPTAADLSSHPVLANRQTILASKDGHASWVSTATLLANGPYPRDIDGGIIVRDKATGKPTGVFIDTAQSLIAPPPITPKIQRQRFTNTVNDVLSVGLTSLHDAGFKPESLEFFSRQAKNGGLPIRIYGMTWFNASSIPSDPSAYWGDRTQKIRDSDGQQRFSVRSVKIFGDGALRTAGAALYEPYSDDPSTSGQMRFTPEVLNEIIPKFLKDGWQVNVHAIGDRANGVVLDAFEVALKEMGLDSFADSQVRPRLEHAQIIAEKDVKRLGRMGVIASVQPTHAISDMWYGEDRLALRGMTIEPAYASFTEKRLGSLEPGKKADFVVLSQDIMKVPVDKILETKVLATVIDGKVVYGGV
ncbi:hypothetical protein CC1G_09259 [Coprinopsis cinerea okayama7|uniref:Amidohydrolase 3 domain-containing protein n=1 Tax=Coprinopsis cinerea (strain Okayama-7 / 130 / ATCC MYA-4618 / FGSC 9003) TaxID=240176 RepID=A8N838_COPC7|nr:hypothetical protein CC1G_09259 [Coprinopsis cinerea okayama7\|eukprot:XP_001830994.2 hypothetical protein CC1G_09259 [Coprinopsis cinerea okayama7\